MLIVEHNEAEWPKQHFYLLIFKVDKLPMDKALSVVSDLFKLLAPLCTLQNQTWCSASRINGFINEEIADKFTERNIKKINKPHGVISTVA